MKNLLQRTVSGIVFLIVIIGSLVLGKFAFGIVFLITGILALLEFYQLVEVGSREPAAIAGMLIGSILFVLAFLISAGMVDFNYLVITAVFPVILFGTALYSKKPDIINEISLAFLGVLYIFVPLAMMCYMAFTIPGGVNYTYRIVLGILILIWINDTGAYVTGTAFGRHKLFPRISPKKSWEGLAGGTILTLSVAFGMYWLMGTLTVADWIVLAVLVSVFGVFGDLTESLLKRNAGKKDSGTLIPGHGGVLDRIDSILFVMPAAFIYLLIKG